MQRKNQPLRVGLKIPTRQEPIKIHFCRRLSSIYLPGLASGRLARLSRGDKFNSARHLFSPRNWRSRRRETIELGRSCSAAFCALGPSKTAGKSRPGTTPDWILLYCCWDSTKLIKIPARVIFRGRTHEASQWEGRCVSVRLEFWSFLYVRTNRGSIVWYCRGLFSEIDRGCIFEFEFFSEGTRFV